MGGAAKVPKSEVEWMFTFEDAICAQVRGSSSSSLVDLIEVFKHAKKEMSNVRFVMRSEGTEANVSCTMTGDRVDVGVM